MWLKALAVFAAILMGSASLTVLTPVPVEAAPKKKKKKIVYKKKVVKKKPVVVVTEQCPNFTITGGGARRGGPGTEAKAEAAAIADWERQARGRFGNAYGLWQNAAGKSTSCKRDVITVRCLAIASPCRS